MATNRAVNHDATACTRLARLIAVIRRALLLIPAGGASVFAAVLGSAIAAPLPRFIS
jgi:hypothetical protein